MWALLTSYLSFFHLIPSLLTCHQSKLNCFHLIRALISPSHLLEVVLSSSQVLHARKPVLSERCLLHKKKHWAQNILAHRHLRHRCIYIQNPFRNTLYYKACAKDFPVLLRTTKLAQSTFQLLLCTTKLAQSTFQLLLCTTKLALSTSQYYFVSQSLHKALSSTTLYYKACTKYFPVRLCTTKLAQSTSQYSVLRSLYKALPSTTLYYKACTKHFPVLLCTTKLAQSISHYYFVLQDLHKALPSTTYFPVLHISQYYIFPSTTL